MSEHTPDVAIKEEMKVKLECSCGASTVLYSAKEFTQWRKEHPGCGTCRMRKIPETVH